MERTKKIFIITIITVAMLSSTILAASGIVNAPSGLVLREEASKSGSPITTVEDKATVEILEQTGEWYKVRYNGEEGFLFAEYVDVDDNIPEPSEEPDNPDNNVTSGENQLQSQAKVYMMPLITSTPIATIAEGTTVNIEKEITNWAYVTDGTVEGWIRTYSIHNQTTEQPIEQQPEPEEPTPEPETPDTPEEPETPAPDNSEERPTSMTAIVNVDYANLRKEASQNSAIVTTLTRGTDVTINAETDKWYKITYIDVDGVTKFEGYMMKNLLKTN